MISVSYISIPVWYPERTGIPNALDGILAGEPFLCSVPTVNDVSKGIFYLDVMSEQWADIPGYEGCYQVSDQGRVKGFVQTKEGRFMSLYTRSERQQSPGYQAVCLTGKANRKTWLVHRLVMLSFVGSCLDGMCVDHINCIRDDNRLDNLRYLDFRLNCSQGGDKLRGISINQGESNGRSKLTSYDVLEIRSLVGTITQTAIGKRFGIGRSAISEIINRKRWKHI